MRQKIIIIGFLLVVFLLLPPPVSAVCCDCGYRTDVNGDCDKPSSNCNGPDWCPAEVPPPNPTPNPSSEINIKCFSGDVMTADYCAPCGTAPPSGCSTFGSCSTSCSGGSGPGGTPSCTGTCTGFCQSGRLSPCSDFNPPSCGNKDGCYEDFGKCSGQWCTAPCSSIGNQNDCQNSGCSWSVSCTTPPPPPATPTPTPTPYPTTAVSGNLQQKLGTNNCLAYPGTGPVPTIGLTPQYPTGVTSSCAANVGAATYQCNVSYDNRNNPSIPLSQSFTLNSYSPGYGTGWWRVGNACGATDTDNTRTFSSGQVSSGNNIFFTIYPWIKLQDGSLQTPGINFDIPAVVILYDDSSDLGHRFLIDGVAGVASTANSSFPSSVPISQNNFSLISYSPDMTKKQHMTASNFLSYTRSRKEYTTLTNPPTNLSTITSNGIYYYNTGGTPLNITAGPTDNGARIVLIIDGDVNITNNLTQSQGFALLVNGSLSLSTSVTEIHGIFVANSFSTGTITSGLKIVGNVSDSSFYNGRSQSDNRKPSVFILSNPQYLFDLLPWLNTRKYDWRQLQ